MRDHHNKVYKSFYDIIEGKKEDFSILCLENGCLIIVVCLSLSLHMWIAPRNSNRTFLDISNLWYNPKTFCFKHKNY
ncbi:DNA-directed RNA polymerase subunit beta', partial [Mucuna pruriens]